MEGRAQRLQTATVIVDTLQLSHQFHYPHCELLSMFSEMWGGGGVNGMF